jgi:formylglycine-generating enzyme required for sulfatase activity/tetratricopeptide (TPR) repeat protein
VPEVSTNELRWLIGKVVHCATRVSSVAQFEDWMRDVEFPDEILELLPEEVHADRVHAAAHAALLSACWLYGHGSEKEARVQAEINAAIARVLELPDALPDEMDNDGDTRPGTGDELPADGPNGNGAAAGPTSAEQHVTVGRDVNAPIVNAAGGTVYVNDRSGACDRMLHDYLTFLVYVSFGVKRPNVTDAARNVLDEAMQDLVRYHGKTRRGTIGASPEMTHRAPAVYDKVDTACRKIFGLSFDDSRPALSEYPFPSFPLFEDMVLIRGGHDPYTGSDVGPYYLSRYPVTVGQYAEFCRVTNHPPVPEWQTMSPPPGLANHPVTGVTLFNTVLFCLWLELATGFRFRVPTEPEWCFAATRGERRDYPWGDRYLPERATTALESPRGTQPVDRWPLGASRDGIMDMAGNTWDLTSTLFDEDPAAPDMNFTFPPMMFALARPEWWETDRRVPRGAGPWEEAARFVMRGGSFGGGPEWATMDQRIWTSMFNRGAYGGFRIACSAEPVGDGFVPTPSFVSPRIGGFADRIELVNADGSEAIVQKQFSGCGGGSTWEGGLRDHLLEVAVLRYEGVDGRPFADEPIELGNYASRVASATRFPRLSQRVKGLPAARPSPPPNPNERLLTELRSRLAPASLRAVEFANEEANASGDEAVGTPHLLAGLLRLDDLTISPALLSFGLTLDVVRAHVGRGVDARGSAADGLPLSAGARHALSLDDEGDEFHRAYPMELLYRLVREPDDDIRALLDSSGADAETIEAAAEDAYGGWRLLRSRSAPPSRAQVERALTTYRRAEGHGAGTAVPVLGALLTALANHLDREGQPLDEVGAVDAEAAAYRRRLTADSRPHDGLSHLLGARFLLLHQRGRDGEALAVLDEAIAIDAESKDADSRAALAWGLMNRSVVLGELGRTEEAVTSGEMAIALQRELTRRNLYAHGLTLALALSNRSSQMSERGRGEEARRAIVEAVQIAVPLLRGKSRAAVQPSLTPDMLEENYLDASDQAGVAPDRAVVKHLRALRERADEEDGAELPELPALDPAPLKYLAPAADGDVRCSFCDEARAGVAGVGGCICVECLSMAAEVLQLRDLDAPETEPALRREYDDTCSLCAWSKPQREVVRGHDGGICRGCHARAIELLNSR